MNGLQEQYVGKIDFMHLNVDDQASLAARERFNLVQRSQYIVIDAQGNEIARWTGILSQPAIEEVLNQLVGA